MDPINLICLAAQGLYSGEAYRESRKAYDYELPGGRLPHPSWSDDQLGVQMVRHHLWTWCSTIADSLGRELPRERGKVGRPLVSWVLSFVGLR